MACLVKEAAATPGEAPHGVSLRFAQRSSVSLQRASAWAIFQRIAEFAVPSATSGGWTQGSPADEAARLWQ